MHNRPNLRNQIIIGLSIYSLILTFIVGIHGYIVNENIEKLVWKTVLDVEFDYIKKRLDKDPDFSGSVKDSFYWYDEKNTGKIPQAFLALNAGIHDEIDYDNKKFVVMVEEKPYKQILAMDITHIETYESMLLVSTFVFTLIVVLLMAITAYWALGRLINPILQIAKDISKLPPNGVGNKIHLEKSVPYESFLISDALNQYMDRIQQYIHREKNFINTASHELRTPISVISGAMEVALNHPDTASTIIPHLQRAARVSHEMEELLALLLTLARDKDRLKRISEVIDLQSELPIIIENHLFLCTGKKLTIENQLTSPLLISAPAQVLRIAIGNLVRNAIENSDNGVIQIYAKNQTLFIADPGQDMDAAELREFYTQLALSGKKGFGGIGIDLILRLCEHFEWQLQFKPAHKKGTIVMLTFK
ncbi:HAMP domain-containing histidine kinase [Acinetobacter sp. C26M]|uniref:sensor histidine kinase n=1 Tax=unclassified Acinetobacter TaxID=196816 RepID=UPI0020376642|nr:MULTISPECIES: HAMP domain-containing sensor histidine kinase [unclassified Acinetobacter]USA45698.1 HAMP domain-containing histidine kinase [Acinetobacter sp. C26M]USA49197.1 HAMP domain-containing histidine kinase [Acinetobacter sp. C26G]